MVNSSYSQRYHAFVVRLSQESEQAPWRIFLQAADTGERMTFANLEELLVYLQRVCEGDGTPVPPPEGADNDNDEQ